MNMSLLFSNDLCSAYVVEIVKSFQALKPNAYLGRTALQKLVYFTKATGVPVPCSFEIYNFGPYSEEVSRSVNSLLADEAIQDVSPATDKYSSYKPYTNSNEFSGQFTSEVDAQRRHIDSIVKVLGGERPATLELVATLHFVNAKQKGLLGRLPDYDQVVRQFKDIKANKFADIEIQRWYEWLKNSRLL